jgi:superfamily II DNA or RNA helicase
MKKCKIIIRDEVNAKIEGLDLDARRALVKKFSYEIPGAKYLPSVRLGRWDGKASYFQLGGSTYINLLEEILPYLEECNYDIELEDTRDYSTVFEFSEINENSFSHKTWPAGHPIAGQPIVLRDYQVEIVNKFLNNPQSMQEIATGSGKTIITAALSYCCENSGRTIVVVPNKSLVTQTEADYINLGLDVGVYFGDRKEHGRKHTICTWQSLNNLLKNTKDGNTDITIDEFIDGVICIMIDEAHSVKADALKTLLSGVMSKIPIRWGLTGTIPKDKYASQALFTCIGSVIGKLSANELQNVGVLSMCHVNVVQMQDNAEFRDYQSELSHLLTDEKRLNVISSLIEKIVDSGNTLILVDRVAAGEELVKRLPNSVFIRGKTKLKERKEEYDEVAISDDKIIVATYGVAAVGINIPRIFNLVLLEPGKSFVRVIQSIGRGIRKAEDKDFVQIWDITSSCRFAKRHLTKRKEFYREANYPYTIEKLEYK